MPARRKKFKTEVQQLLDIVIHSLYSNRDIFLRELISNASDAIDLARFQSLSDESILEDDPDWKIKLVPDKESRTLIVSDNGIGMTREEVEKNIGTIARSGTRQFLEAMQQKKQAASPELIGQFGVGFYSAFMVADKVTVLTRPAGSKDGATRWASTGSGSYTVEDATKETRGTEIVLHLKEDAEEYLEEWKLRKIVKQYSDFVEYPITMDVSREETPRDAEGNEIADAEKKVTVTEETLNSRKALWTRPRNEISEDDYHEFYKHISHDFTDPLETIHWQVEGTTEFRALLYMPQHTLPEMTMPENRHRGVHLYIRRVYITDNCEALLPQYLRFLRGVVDSSDLPLNISREMLQEERLVRVIRNNLIKKTLDTLAEMKDNDREKYVTFWNQFGTILKEGIHFDFANREKIQELLLFESSKTSPGEYTTLSEYVERMPESQKEIYYITGESRQAVERSPFLEALRSRDLEVLFLTDPIDEWVVPGLMSYQEKPLRSIAKGEIELDSAEEQKEREEQREKAQAEYKDLVEFIKNELGDKVKDVKLSTRLTESACCLVSDEAGMGVHMEKILKAMQQELPAQKRILELNPQHVLLDRMHKLLGKPGQQERLQGYVSLLYDQALLTAGLPVEDPLRFTQRMSDLMAEEASYQL